MDSETLQESVAKGIFLLSKVLLHQTHISLKIQLLLEIKKLNPQGAINYFILLPSF